MKSESNRTPKATLPLADRDHIQGPITAPIALVEYGDYECPYCGEAHSIVKAIQQRLGDRLCFAFRNFPLTNAHPHAEHAAEACEAAGALGHFWQMHDMVFENQDALEDDDLMRYALGVGLEARQFGSEVQNAAHRTRIREDFRGGARNGVNGTPTFFINGDRYDGEVSLNALLAALTEAEE